MAIKEGVPISKNFKILNFWAHLNYYKIKSNFLLLIYDFGIRFSQFLSFKPKSPLHWSSWDIKSWISFVVIIEKKD